MENRWLIIDGNYLCHRAFHAMGRLEYGEVQTGLYFGFLRDLVYFMEYHDTNKVALCFDKGLSKRMEMFPDYKRTRRDRYANGSPAERNEISHLQKQINVLRDIHLPRMGFSNVLYEGGFEADDIIASVVQTSLEPGEEAIIISADSDLYQLLSEDVVIWNPNKKKTLTVGWLVREFGVYPAQWPTVKAIAGCDTDDIPGVRGVGESTAAKFVAGLLNPKTKKSEDIIAQTKKWQKNLKLVTLPLKNTPRFKLAEDNVTEEKWGKVCERLGMESLKDNPPIPGRRRKKHGKNLRK